MQELILKPENGVVLQPGEAIDAGSEPLTIRFGKVDFTIDTDPPSADTPHEELILQPEQKIILSSGEQLAAGNQPLWIRYGLIDFSVKDGSTQQQIQNAVARHMKYAAPTNWRIETVKHARQQAQHTEGALVLIVPSALTWKRTSRGKPYVEHQIDIIVLGKGKIDTDNTVALIDRWAKLFLVGGGLLEKATCMNADTFEQAPAGYSLNALTDTPSMFIGGLRLTFWEFE